jgi:hypothetical protein
MSDNKRELLWALITLILITIIYLFVVTTAGGIPAAQGFFGHSLGIIGFILMLLTETLYSIRKRRQGGGWGKMETWLQVHIYTGLVGPYMVLLHTSWKFNGLAGLLALFTLIIVGSGFIGRYIYTMVPRSVDGVLVEGDELVRRMRSIDAQLRSMVVAGHEANQTQAWVLSTTPTQPLAASENSLTPLYNSWKSRREWNKEKKRLGPGARQQIKQLEALLNRRATLQRQVNSLAKARQILAIWHTLHVPLGIVLFATAFAHIAAAIYYATLLR